MDNTDSTLSQGELALRLGYSSWARYAGRADFIFHDLHLAGKRVLDVGCGKGAWIIWCALHGASGVGIEPEEDGATQGTFATFSQTLAALNLQTTIQANRSLMEDYLAQHPDEKFDVIVLFNVINHLAEDAVVRLPTDIDAVGVYREKFMLLRKSLAANGVLILADCARSNLWKGLPIRHPFAPTIEWQKHADPDVWTALAAQAGFAQIDLRWSYLYPFRRASANRLVSYVTTSHFVLRLQAV